MPVDRCVCHRVTFQELAAIAKRDGCDLDSLADRTGCTTGCGMCKPYVQLMLESGRTSFDPLPQTQGRPTKAS
ncbi:MAG: (2Fe-2S)-binding protein [Planctomycetota bacterium]